MDVGVPERHRDSQIDWYPLLMEQVESSSGHQHIIDVERNGDASLTASHVELVVTVGQIIASIVVLSLSRHENPEAPLFAWVVGYASGCVATLPILYWRYHSGNRGSDQQSSRSHRGTSHSSQSEPRSYTAISVAQSSDEANQHSEESASWNGQIADTLSSRISGLVDHFKMALDCYFAVWFVVGNVWIFGGHSSPSDAPKLYRLCIVFLTFSCVGYAMPFILCGDNLLLPTLHNINVFHVECIDKWLKINASCPL
ncbi:hypothetical protein EUGRSUZ_L01668 [Eucalyptus grandis]|uniref:Uncharacterized protein n=3 Tax=Eucalyptus grandis TaxID=71139 RepID=A0AAD9TAI6_EUCGR|nr:hypothetical protein EUGRSUZ_L01668 [Eucalyptus grandis]